MSLKSVVEAALKNSGKTKSDLARDCGWSPQKITNILNGYYGAPKIETLQRIAAALGVHVSRLMDDDEPEVHPPPAQIVASNIGIILRRKKLRSADLARLLGISADTLAKRLASSMSGKHIGEISEALGVSVASLTMPPTSTRPKVPNSTRVNLAPHTAKIPIWLSINAGPGEDGDHFTGQRDGDILVPDEYIQRKVFALRVAGDSMEPELHEGDIALFEPLAPGARPSSKRIYAVEVQGWAEMVVKRVKTEQTGVILVSTNPLVKPVYLDPSLTAIRLRGELIESRRVWKDTAVLAEDAAEYRVGKK